ncbi:lysophospholipid acyltransferase family protein [Candidatus Nitrosacidococcus tergens]|uniref:Phospholipid/glycerol acyltransferase domain-containing protein n=1 Tax=Candidatus Nitrosacidococcus tergens TaxID=553981 RepID=A0A7G1QAM0_9GAMM|nr:hypothetical protein [Candidatus Nitrosacidococcus tergens]CAB1276551.1 protein of unknown function [Candidatus Nitrosacidococcus tergens]
MSFSAHQFPARNQKPSLWARFMWTMTDLIVCRLYPCFITGLEHYSQTSGTLAVSNHRRDNDGPLVASKLLLRKNGGIVAPLPSFAAREDLFEKRFLANYLHCWPGFVRYFLGFIYLRPFLVGTYPLQRTHGRGLASVLHEVIDYLGDMPIVEVLRPKSLTYYAAKLGFNPNTTTVKELLKKHEYILWQDRYGYRHFQIKVFTRLKPFLNSLIDQQIDFFVQMLNHDQVILLEPEGQLSLDGSLQRPRSALYDLITRSSNPVHVLPISITYDSLTIQKQRIFIDIQPELSELEKLPKHIIDDQVTRSVWAGCRVTGSQLAFGFLHLNYFNSKNYWSEVEMFEHVYAAAQRCQQAKIPIDPCLENKESCKLRILDILTWGKQQKFFAMEGDLLHIIDPDMPPPWLPNGASTLLEYLRTELLETVGIPRAYDLGLLPALHKAVLPS